MTSPTMFPQVSLEWRRLGSGVYESECGRARIVHEEPWGGPRWEVTVEGSFSDSEWTLRDAKETAARSVMRSLVRDAVERGKREILADVSSGKVPATVVAFSELHEFVDANEYGGLTDDASPLVELLAGAHVSVTILAANWIQSELSEWLRTRASAQAVAVPSAATAHAPDPKVERVLARPAARVGDQWWLATCLCGKFWPCDGISRAGWRHGDAERAAAEIRNGIC